MTLNYVYLMGEKRKVTEDGKHFLLFGRPTKVAYADRIKETYKRMLEAKKEFDAAEKRMNAIKKKYYGLVADAQKR